MKFWRRVGLGVLLGGLYALLFCIMSPLTAVFVVSAVALVAGGMVAWKGV